MTWGDPRGFTGSVPQGHDIIPRYQRSSCLIYQTPVLLHSLQALVRIQYVVIEPGVYYVMKNTMIDRGLINICWGKK